MYNVVSLVAAGSITYSQPLEGRFMILNYFLINCKNIVKFETKCLLLCIIFELLIWFDFCLDFEIT
jgi:hypothetical protein